MGIIEPVQRGRHAPAVLPSKVLERLAVFPCAFSSSGGFIIRYSANLSPAASAVKRLGMGFGPWGPTR